MGQEIITRTISSVTDKKLSLSNGKALRPFEYTNTWSVVRVGILFSLNGSANILGTPQLTLGVCAGELGWPDATDNFVGMRSSIAISSWAYNAGAPAYYNIGTPTVAKKVGAVITSGGGIGIGAYASSAPSSIRSAIIVEISKGTPDFTVIVAVPASSAAAQTDVTPALFTDMMNALALSDVGSIVTGYNASSGITIAVDEGTDGDLDHMAIYWDKNSAKLELSDTKHRKVS